MTESKKALKEIKLSKTKAYNDRDVSRRPRSRQREFPMDNAGII